MRKLSKIYAVAAIFWLVAASIWFGRGDIVIGFINLGFAVANASMAVWLYE